MGVISKIFNNPKSQTLEEFIDTIISAKSKQLQVKQHAIQHAVDIIAKTIAKSEIQVYRYDQKEKKIKSIYNEEYYKLNVRPNHNEQATSFFYKCIKKYLEEEDALIVNFNGQLYLADNYTQSNSLLLPKTYSNVQISDDKGNSMIFNHTFTDKEVIKLNLTCSEIKETLDSYYQELGKLIGIASSRYKLTNSSKFRLKVPGGQPKLIDPVTKEEVDYNQYKNKLTKGLFEEEDSIIMLSEIFGLEKINFGDPTNSEEWDKLEKKWSDKVAMSFNIPLDIFYGNKTDKSTSTNDFITFGVLPHLQTFEDGLNSKIIEKKDFLKGERIRVNRLNMQHRDILETASNMDKLFSNGYSHNQINEIIGMPLVDEAWADEHHITKNYENVNVATKGGDGNE